MLPDVLTSQVRDEAAGVPVGYRVVRIATHHAVRSRGLGSALLDAVRAEVRQRDPLAPRLAAGAGSGGERAGNDRDGDRDDCGDDGNDDDEDRVEEAGVDWLGVGYGATPRLLSFWRENGFSAVYLSTSRNEASGEHSVVMLDPLSPAGTELRERHTRWFRDRLAGVLSDPLRGLDPDVVRAALRTVDGATTLSLTAREWRVVVDASFGPGLYSVDPGAFRRLALRALTTGESEREALTDDRRLPPRAERLLVRKVLQGHPWPAVADELGFVSPSQCMKALGRAYRPLVERYGSDAAAAHRERYD
jgi:tRNA(Met) cytidine acetyltransferase